MSTIVAYVDGSYNKKIHQCSYAAIFLDGEEKNVIGSVGGLVDDLDYCNMRNVGGEVLSSTNAISYAIEEKYDSIIIYYDYKGIYEWVRGDAKEWTANNRCTQAYKDFVKDKSKLINITFKKVTAHSQNKYNDMADRLAKDFALIK